MDLRTYLFQKRISVVDFSKTIGCSRIHLSEIINGRRVPSLMMSKLIEMATNGEVTIDSFSTSKQNENDLDTM